MRVFKPAPQPNQEELSPRELITVTRQHFAPPDPDNERLYECIFFAAHALLIEMDDKSEHFNHMYDVIVFGSIVIAKAMRVGGQGLGEPAPYDKNLHNLMTLCGLEQLRASGDTSKDPNMRKMIIGVGEGVLDGSLTFKAEFLDEYTLNQHVPLLKRLQVYLPNLTPAIEPKRLGM